MIRSIIVACAALALPVAAHAQSAAAPAPMSPKLRSPTPPGKPKPISPASWVTNDDYPAAAIRAFEYGTVGFKLNVDATGKVTGCTIIASSGSALLDSTACRVLSARARFEPALDQQGRAIPSTYVNRFRWELPTQEQPFESWAKVIQFDVSPSGEISHCSLEMARIATRSDVCGQLVDTTPEVRAKLAEKAGPVTVELRNAWRIDGSPAVIAADPAAATTVFRHRTHFEVNAFGDISQCQVLENTGEDIMRLARFDCRENVRFPALPDGDKTARWVTTTTSMTTRPAAPGDGEVPQRYTGTPLTAIAAGSWVTPGDYPGAALRAEEAGKVRFRLDVSGSGVPTNCAVIASSGSASLDETTCSLLLKRARFVGARGPGGDPLTTSYVNQVRWELPEDPVMPLASWSATVRFTIGADSQLMSCAYKGYAAPDSEGESPCVEVSAMPRATMRALRGQSKGPVTIAVRFDHEVEGMAMPPVPALAASLKRIALWSGGFDIDTQGYPTDCHGAIDGRDMPAPAVCGREMRYGHQDAVHKASIRIAFYSDGDSSVAAALPTLGGLFE